MMDKTAQVGSLVVKITCDTSEATAAIAALQAQVESLTKQFTELKSVAQDFSWDQPQTTLAADESVSEFAAQIAHMAKYGSFTTPEVLKSE